MAISKQFQGATIYKPGAYSAITVDNDAGSSLLSSSTLFLIGESSKGAPGSVSGLTVFDQAQLAEMVSMYGSGPLVDCAIAAARPSNQNGIAGFGTLIVWKTNASTQATGILKKSTSNQINVADLSYGANGNSYMVQITAGDSGSQRNVAVAMIGGTTESLGENAAIQILEIKYTGNASTALASITGASDSAKMLVTVLDGDQTDGSAPLSIALAGRTMNQLVQLINAQVGYQAVLLNAQSANLPATDLDLVSATSIEATFLPMLRLQHEILDLLNTSQRIQATLPTLPIAGVPDVQTITLAGGAQGASANSDFGTGLATSLSEDYNVVVPCVSRDASVDSADAIQGFTSTSSTYTIAGVLAATESHLALRWSVLNHKEAAGFCGFRSNTKATAFSTASGLNSQYLQMTMQDCLMLDQNSNQVWKHPHVMAAFAAGMRCGQAVGEPLTYKFPAVQSVGHFVNPVTGLAAGDFNPSVDYTPAIQAGVLFTEKNSGGFRWVVDNTTYGIDGSFVFNRGSVMFAVAYVNRYLRNIIEQNFIGHRVSNGAAASIKAMLTQGLLQLNAPSVGIIVASTGAPSGFDPKTFIVSISGNTATINLAYYPTQGIDFAFFNFTIKDLQQSA